VPAVAVARAALVVQQCARELAAVAAVSARELAASRY